MSDAETVDTGDHEMRTPRVEKVVVHMGVGQGGRALSRAEGILSDLTGQDPVRTLSKSTQPEFGIREGTPIGTKVTLRGAAAHEFLETALRLVTLSSSQFDEYGNVSFGIAEHTEFPSQEYDPAIGIYGLDVTVNLIRPGYRVRKRNIASGTIPARHRLDPADAMDFLRETFDVTFEGEDDE